MVLTLSVRGSHDHASVPEVRDIARANRAFLQRAVRYLAKEKGITQVAAEAAPGTRVVYVDNDPIVHAHANALLTGTGTTRVVLADLRHPQAILAHPEVRGFLDFTRPVALLLIAILHFILDAEDPVGIVAALRDGLPAGSWLALSHGTTDFHPAPRSRRSSTVSPWKNLA